MFSSKFQIVMSDIEFSLEYIVWAVIGLFIIFIGKFV